MRFFHKHKWVLSDNTHGSTRTDYPYIRTCACGHQMIMRSAWKGKVKSSLNKDGLPLKPGEVGEEITVSTPDVWFNLTQRY